MTIQEVIKQGEEEFNKKWERVIKDNSLGRFTDKQKEQIKYFVLSQLHSQNIKLLQAVVEDTREIVEQLAELEHEQWIEWSKSLALNEEISPGRLERWQTLWKPYAELTEAQKDQDRVYAYRCLSLIKQQLEEEIKKLQLPKEK